MAKQILFVCGVARSGTTALCELLNLHPEVIVGVERYKGILMGAPGDQRLDNLFSRERFFKFQDGDTNIKLDDERYVGIYESARGKFDDAIYVGDKVPGYYKKIPYLIEKFSDAKVVYTVREPVGVAASWQARADSNGKSWPMDNGYIKAVEEWNSSVKKLLKLKSKFRSEIVLVSYERLFGEHSDRVWEFLCRALGLSVSSSEELHDFTVMSKKQVAKTKVFDAKIAAYVRENADFEGYSKLLLSVI